MNSNSSAALNYSHLQEASILTRAVENVVRSMVKMLVGRMSLARLQEMLRVVFVEESEKFLERERPGKKVSMTSLAILTGLDTRTLDKVRSQINEDINLSESERFLREITPECSIVDYWQVNEKYLDPNTHQPLELPLKGVTSSIEALIGEVLTSRGVTATSVVDRLMAAGTIEINDKTGNVRLVEKRFLPFNQEDETAALEIGLISVKHLMETIENNLRAMRGKSDPFYQRITWTNRLNHEDVAVLSKQVRNRLQNSEKEITEILAEMEDDSVKDSQTTAGVCLYYFQE